MISNYYIKNFKNHKEDFEYKFNGLTILTGTNNSGKSSLLQSLRLLSLVNEDKSQMTRLPFEKVTELKSFKDTLNKDVSRENSNIIYQFILDIPNFDFCHLKLVFGEEISSLKESREDQAIMKEMDITFKKDGEEEEIKFTLQNDEKEYWYQSSGLIDDKYIKFNGLVPETNFYGEKYQNNPNKELFTEITQQEDLNVIFTFLSKIHPGRVRYLSSYRNIKGKEIEGGSNNLDIHGENTANIIYSLKDKEIFDGNKKFIDVFNLWTDKIIDMKFKSKIIDGVPQLVTEENGIPFTLNQLGFGVTQILPIIVLLLSSKKEDLVIIENPEVHLHPKWRSDLVDLFYFAIKNGVKLIIETHSIELMNRVRLKIKNDNDLNPMTFLYFFEKGEFKTLQQQIDIMDTGKLEIWPDNFIDKVTFEDTFNLL